MRPDAFSAFRPKISSMPRQKTEAAAYLDLYKLAVEKKRLQVELETIEQRRLLIQKRLTVLNSQMPESVCLEQVKLTNPVVESAELNTTSFKTQSLEY